MIKCGRIAVGKLAMCWTFLAFALTATAPAMATEIVHNGSFEALGGVFVDSGGNYMALGNGSTFITGWTVSTSSGAIVLGRSPTTDGYTAADGAYFVDLSGYGSSSPDGALNQMLSTVGGVTYQFSMDIYSSNTGMITASVGGHSLALTAGTPFSVGGTSWTPETATFIGDSINTTPLLTIANGTPGSQLDFVDHVSITGTVPEPATWGMMLFGFAGIGFIARRRALKTAPAAT